MAAGGVTDGAGVADSSAFGKAATRANAASSRSVAKCLLIQTPANASVAAISKTSPHITGRDICARSCCVSSCAPPQPSGRNSACVVAPTGVAHADIGGASIPTPKPLPSAMPAALAAAAARAARMPASAAASASAATDDVCGVDAVGAAPGLPPGGSAAKASRERGAGREVRAPGGGTCGACATRAPGGGAGRAADMVGDAAGVAEAVDVAGAAGDSARAAALTAAAPAG